MTHSLESVRSAPPATLAVGAIAVGALALGVLAIGFLAINWLFVRRARFDRLEIGDFTVGRLRIRKQIEDTEPDWGF